MYEHSCNDDDVDVQSYPRGKQAPAAEVGLERTRDTHEQAQGGKAQHRCKGAHTVQTH